MPGQQIIPQYCDVPHCHNLATAVAWRSRGWTTYQGDTTVEVWLCDYHDARMRAADIANTRR